MLLVRINLLYCTDSEVRGWVACSKNWIFIRVYLLRNLPSSRVIKSSLHVVNTWQQGSKIHTNDFSETISWVLIIEFKLACNCCIQTRNTTVNNDAHSIEHSLMSSVHRPLVSEYTTWLLSTIFFEIQKKFHVVSGLSATQWRAFIKHYDQSCVDWLLMCPSGLGSPHFHNIQVRIGGFPHLFHFVGVSKASQFKDFEIWLCCHSCCLICCLNVCYE